MNANYGFQLYQAQRPMSRAEMLAVDALRGRRAARFMRRGGGLARSARASATSAVSAVTAIAARTSAGSE